MGSLATIDNSEKVRERDRGVEEGIMTKSGKAQCHYSRQLIVLGPPDSETAEIASTVFYQSIESEELGLRTWSAD